MLDFREILARQTEKAVLNVWSACYLCLLAKQLKLSRQYLVTVLEKEVESRPLFKESLDSWSLRFTSSVLTYYDMQFSPSSLTDYLLACLTNELAAINIAELCEIKVMMNFEDEFPRSLNAIQAKAALLFYKGDINRVKCNSVPTVAIVGSRKMTNYGAAVIKQIISNLSLYQVNIVSGLAYGCDITAHRLSLTYGLSPIAVLPNGLARCYPAAHKGELKKIAEKGLVISEFLPWQQAQPTFFAARNRLISGFAEVVLIIEAALKSGSLITASFAADQGREVLAVPGAITQAYSAGCNRLILDGCQPYLEISQVIDILNANNSFYKLTLKSQIDYSLLNLEYEEKLGDKQLPLVTNSINHAKLATLICQTLQDNVSMLSQDLFAYLQQKQLEANLPELKIGDFLSTLEILELSGKVKKQRMQYYLASK